MVTRVHHLRWKHEKTMALALSLVEEALYLARHEHAMEGWKRIQDVIAHLVNCGCPRELWPEKVRAMIGVDA